MLLVLKDGDEAPVVLEKKYNLKNGIKFLKEHALKKPYYEDDLFFINEKEDIEQKRNQKD